MLKPWLTNWLNRDSQPQGDALLIQRFISQNDQQAFSELVRKHGPMVLSIAKRTLHNEEDAHDVFQATFLVLARKARQFEAKTSIASYLFGITQRVSWKMRTQKLRRNKYEANTQSKGSTSTAKEASEELAAAEMRMILDEEISQLPLRYRKPFILFYSQGYTREETATQLGWPAGTVAGRLARARNLLKDRLVRRGITPAVALAAVTTTVNALPVSPLLVQATTLLVSRFALHPDSTHTSNALLLAQGVLNMLFWKKAIATLLLAAALTGAGIASYWGLQQIPAKDASIQSQETAKGGSKSPEQLELEKFQGTWRVESFNAVTNKLEKVEDYLFKGKLYVKRSQDLRRNRAEIESPVNQVEIHLSDKIITLFESSFDRPVQPTKYRRSVSYKYSFSADNQKLNLIPQSETNWDVWNPSFGDGRQPKEPTFTITTFDNPNDHVLKELKRLSISTTEKDNILELPKPAEQTTSLPENRRETLNKYHQERVKLHTEILEMMKFKIDAGQLSPIEYAEEVLKFQEYMLNSSMVEPAEKADFAKKCLKTMGDILKIMEARQEMGVSSKLELLQTKLRMVQLQQRVEELNRNKK